MKAKVVKGININSLDEEIYMIMIQKEKGKRYDNGLLDDSGMKPYCTRSRKQAREKVNELNKAFNAPKYSQP